DKVMPTKLTWKRGFFSETYKIFSDNNLIGSFNKSVWKNIAFGELNGKKFEFTTTGIFKQQTDIIDSAAGKSIGKIIYNKWGTKAQVEIIPDSVYNWKYDNLWNTKWSLSDSSSKPINFKCSSSKGEIDIEEMNESLILAGLFISNFYMQNAIVVAVAIFVPVLAAASR
ncbi:MAG: hypothetical protein K8H86_07460, partial [Ignavibacteriaceae bacterium]|nr:hypothetical protein [Ignavibacteriaceae bacterium]